MRATTVGDTAKDFFRSVSAALKRFWMMYRNGGYEDDWAFARVSNDVVDINTKKPITGLVMRKVIDGNWAYRQMTESERSDYDEGRHW